MTRYYAVLLEGPAGSFMAFKNADQAEAYDMALTADGYESKTVGAIDGDAYLVVYYKPDKATKKAKRYNSTTAEEKGPQVKAQAHRCRGCQSCAHKEARP